MKKPYYLGVIPARGGSKRIPRKNLALFGEKPLIAYSIEAALKSTRLSKTIVSTDDREIADYSRSLGADVPFLRPAGLARDQSDALGYLLHALSFMERGGTIVDAIVLMQPTSPFRTSRHIDQCIDLFEKSKADTVTSVCAAAHHPFHAWTQKKTGRLKPFFSLRYQFITKDRLPPAFIENGVVYIIRRSTLLKKTLYGKTIVPYLMDRRGSLDIDTVDDMQWGEYVLKSA